MNPFRKIRKKVTLSSRLRTKLFKKRAEVKFQVLASKGWKQAFFRTVALVKAINNDHDNSSF